MASESDDSGSIPRSGTINDPEPASSEHSHDLESVAQASDLDHHDHPSSLVSGQPPLRPPPPSPPNDEDDDGGGPVKTFLEHLEDLRWMLIKAGASILIGMVVCLVAAPQLIDVLLRPLKQADLLRETKEQLVVLSLGSNVLWRLPRSDFPGLPKTEANKHIESYQLVPLPDGTNFVLALQPEPWYRPSENLPTRTAIKNYGPLEPFTVALQIALYGGIGLASPFVLYFIGEFVVPALRRKEKRLVYRGLGIGSVLFMCGVVFCYFVMLQLALNTAVNISRWMHFGADEWRAPEYLSFVLKFMLGMGLAFELPVILLTLVAINLLDYQKLTKFRPYWVVINLIISALLTPPDPLSMILMAIPLQVLYEISVFISWIWKRKAVG